MNVCTRVIIITIILLSFVAPIFAQQPDRQSAIDDVALSFMREAENQSVLFYGLEQQGHPRVNNHPYLMSEQYTSGRLSFNGVIYPEVLLRLDLNRDELVILSPDFRHIVLQPEHVDFAELHGRHIIHHRQCELPGSPATGYYFLLHSGKTRVLLRQTASLSIVSHSRQQHFTLTHRFFLYKDGEYHLIRNRRTLLRTLEPHRRELRRFASSNRLRFRSSPEVFITLVAKEYEKLSSQ